MTKEERIRVGRKLRAMRVERTLDQIDVAANPKVKMSVGTLQAIENAWYDVRDTNIEKYAQFFGTSLTRLLKADAPNTVPPTHPLLKDLNEEHLSVARGYMRARKTVRTCIELLLSGHPAEDSLTTIFTTLAALPPERLPEFAALLTVDTDGRIASLLDRVRQRLLTDPGYVDSVEQHLTLLDERETPKPEPQRKTRPPHRA